MSSTKRKLLAALAGLKGITLAGTWASARQSSRRQRTQSPRDERKENRQRRIHDAGPRAVTGTYSPTGNIAQGHHFSARDVAWSRPVAAGGRQNTPPPSPPPLSAKNERLGRFVGSRGAGSRRKISLGTSPTARAAKSEAPTAIARRNGSRMGHERKKMRDGRIRRTRS